MLLRIPFYGLFFVAFFCALIVFFGVGDTADVKLGWALSQDDIQRAKKLLHEGSKVRPEEMGTIALSKEDLNLVANYLLNRYSYSAVNISLKPNQLKFTATSTLPKNPVGKYVNFTLALGNIEGEQLPKITKFKAGRLLLPSPLAAAVIDFAIRHSALNRYFLLATRPIKAVSITAEQITLSYSSSLKTLIEARKLITSSNNEVVSVYRQKISEVVSQHNPKERLSLADLLRAGFSLALERSTESNAIEENRFAIIAINDYVNQNAEQVVHNLNPVENTPQQPVFMYQREDLALHFIGSAALTASMNTQISSAFGEEKELHDAETGSGFSFIDLAADKTGTRFGELATSTPENARKLQHAMAKIKSYNEFMPDPRDLPEHMNKSQFILKFDSVHSVKYQQLLQEIDRRINATQLYRQP